MSEREPGTNADDGVAPREATAHQESATPAPIRAMRVIALSRDTRPLSRPPGAALPGSIVDPRAEVPLPTFEDRPTPDWHDIKTAQIVPPEAEAADARHLHAEALDIEALDPEQETDPPWHDAPASALPSFADELSEEPTPVYAAPTTDPRQSSSVPPPRLRSDPRALAPEAIEEILADELADLGETPLAGGSTAIPLASGVAPTHIEDDVDAEIDVDVEPTPVSAPEVIAKAPPALVSPALVTPMPLADEARSQLPAAADRPPPPRRASGPGSGRPALPTSKVRKKPWWEEVFGDDFSRTYRSPTRPQISREADFIVDQFGLAHGAVILDLACGQGEYAVELSRRNFSVVGYDLSVFQLAMAADHAQAAGQRINFLQGDMREMAFEGMFDGILLWNTSFGYFEEDRNFDVLCRIRNALRPGGALLIEVLNRDYAACEAPISNWYEGDGCICMDDMSLDFITSRLTVKRSVILDDGRSKEVTYSVRLYCLSEIGKLLHDAGFTVQAVSGAVSTPGAFLGVNSPSMIIRAQRPLE